MGTEAANFFHVDSGLSYNGAPAIVFGGLQHLEGEEVAILANGDILANQTVSGGTITLATAASIVHAGLPYNTDIKTLRMDPGDGSFQGKIKRIHKLILRLFQTMGYQFGKDEDSLDTVTQTELTTEDVEKTFEGIYDTLGQVFIRKSDAGPLTLLAIIPLFEVYDR